MFLEEIQRAESDCQHLRKTIDNLHKRISLMNKQMHVEHTEEESLTRVTILTEDDLFRSLTVSFIYLLAEFHMTLISCILHGVSE